MRGRVCLPISTTVGISVNSSFDMGVATFDRNSQGEALEIAIPLAPIAAREASRLGSKVYRFFALGGSRGLQRMSLVASVVKVDVTIDGRKGKTRVDGHS